MHLSALYTYPIKGCKGLSHQSVEVGPMGPGLDRRWMIIDETGRFLSQRQLPKMALIDPERFIHLPPQGPPREVSIWKDTCTALDQGDEVAKYLSSFLERECRLVFMPDTTQRSVGDGIVGFADRFPFLLISEASLEDLNHRLEKPVSMNRFRPNLVISGCKPFEEDSWKQIRIGEVTLKFTKQCSRCTVINVDQSTGERGVEPMETLMTFRKIEKVMFGIHLTPTILGSLHVGDAVVLESIEESTS